MHAGTKTGYQASKGKNTLQSSSQSCTEGNTGLSKTASSTHKATVIIFRYSEDWKNCETEAQFAVFPKWLHWRDAWLGRRAQSTRLIIRHYKQHSAWLHEPGLLQMLPGQGLVVCCMIACFRCFALGVLRSIRCFALPQFDCIQSGKHMFCFWLGLGLVLCKTHKIAFINLAITFGVSFLLACVFNVWNTL